jgi:sarcosine oxidase subunit alpha
MSGVRLAAGGACIDRRRPLGFSFEGRAYAGYLGDTLASALLANGVSVVGRSFKYHRPRGLLSAGVEEPNALMQIGVGADMETNIVATQVTLKEGLHARAVNCWPSVDFDIAAANNALARFIPAGFYYKTFLWPNWRVYEPFIRRAAGLGRPARHPDPNRYEMRYAHCDVLVVGAGPAGLAAAVAAASSGARVMLVEQDAALGGSLRWRSGEVDNVPGAVWIERQRAALVASAEVRVLTRTAAMGYFDHNALALLEEVDACSPSAPRARLWQVRAKRVVLATGAIERPIVFAGNDRPGVMLASAVAQYIGDFGVLSGRQAVFFTNNDSAYASAEAYLAAGGKIAAIVDSRPTKSERGAAIEACGVRVICGGAVVATHGRPALSRLSVRKAGGDTIEIAADLLAISGGWSPTLHLHCQSGGAPRWDEGLSCLVPGTSVQSETSVGACAGEFLLSEALAHGAATGAEAARWAGFRFDPPPAPQAVSSIGFSIEPLWRVRGRGKAFVDFQNDVTADDLALAERENFISVEHLKRYTTLGMGTDQGKTSNVNAIGIMSELRQQSAAVSGVTRYRFPYKPIALGALAGMRRGEKFKPRRRLTLHDWHQANGAVFEEYGPWTRPAHYPRAGETGWMAEQREALAVRNEVGIFDGSPLGKIEVLGPDAAKLLDLIYANRMSNLEIGKCRYGLMLNELGVIIDDGVCSRLADDHFLVGTTSAGAGRIAAWLQEWLQCEWVNFEVLVAPITQCFDVITLSGPNARDLLNEVGVDFDISAKMLPHLSWCGGKVGGMNARVFRVSYTGEVSFEINVAPSDMSKLWQRCFEFGQKFGVTPVGVDAWSLLRTERGFLHIGADTDGTTTPLDIGWGRVLQRKTDFIGRRSLLRPADQREDRLNFVGLELIKSEDIIRVGFPVRSKDAEKATDGYVTSAGFSPTLQRHVALGMLERGRARIGEVVTLIGDRGDVSARVTEPGAFDPKGERVHG